jgi:hypothetical protein
MLNIIDLPGDSQNYDVIAEGVKASANVNGISCEIGLRRGGGTKVIIDSFAELGIKKTHIAIDPYGNIEYKPNDFVVQRLDYTNDMRDEALPNIYTYAKLKKINFYFFNMEDTEFFKRFSDGVPVYNEFKTIENVYSFVHFDGPHDVSSLEKEIEFFGTRTAVGGVWVFDDIHDYNHGLVEEEFILKSGFKKLDTRGRKASYIKKD